MEKNKPSRRLSAALWIVVVCFITLFSANLTSAFEIDNVQDYDPITKTYVIENFFGLGETLAEIKLNSESNVIVPQGYQKVAEFELSNFKKDYGNAFKDMNFYQANNLDRELTRTFDYKYLDYQIQEQAIFGDICVENKLNNSISCHQEEIGKENVLAPIWIKFSDINELPSNQDSFTIGIFTDVKKGDYVEWIPTFFGERLTEWATWTQSLNANLVQYWALEDNNANTTVHAQVGTNGVLSGGNTEDKSVSAKVNLGFDLDGAGDYATISDGVTMDTTTINFWINPVNPDSGSSESVFTMTGGSAYFQFNLDDNADSGVRFLVGPAKTDISSQPVMTGGNWYMVTGVFVSGGTSTLYVNAKVNGTDSDTYTGTGATLVIGAQNGGGTPYEGIVDEVSVWERELSQAEVTQLYNNGNGITHTSIFPPGINITFPKNITYNETLTELNYSVDAGADRCWFSTDNGLTNSSNVPAGTNFTGLTSGFLENNWTVYCNNTDATGVETVSFLVNISILTELISPANATDSLTQVISFLINSSAINTNLTNVTLSIWYDNGTLFSTNTTTLSGTGEVQTNFTSTLTDGNYIWNAETCESEGGCNFAASNRTLQIHTTPSSTTIHFPTGTIDLFILGQNSTLNWTVSEPGQNLSAHITNCSFIYNAVEITLNLTQCLVTNQTSFLYVSGVNNLTFRVIEEFGLITNNVTSWNYFILQNSQTFNNVTTEGSIESFSINYTANETPTEINFVYNGSITSANIDSTNFPIVIASESIVVPSVGPQENVSFFWNIVSVSNNINTTLTNQTINNLTLDNCSTFTNRILNLTMVNEEEQFLILPNTTTTIEIAIDLLSVDRSQIINSLSEEFEGNNPLEICLNDNVTGGVEYSVDVIIRYTAVGYAIEYYNIVNLSLTNETTKENITLFSLNATDSTEFQLTFNGEDFLPVENALIFVERQYIAENTFKTVELPKTDSNGQTVLHLVRNDVVYNIRVVRNNDVLGNFLNIIAFCQDITIENCVINLNALTNASAIFNYDDEVGILYDSPPQYNETTNIVSFDFTSTDGTAKTVFLNVERRDIFGNISICDNTVTSISGTVLCNVGAGLSDTSLVTTISVDGEEWIADSVIIDTTGFGNVSYVIWFIMTIGLVLMFSDSKNGIMFSILFSFIGAVSMGWSVGGIVGIGSAGIWVIVMVVIAIWKINKGRKS